MARPQAVELPGGLLGRLDAVGQQAENPDVVVANGDGDRAGIVENLAAAADDVLLDFAEDIFQTPARRVLRCDEKAGQVTCRSEERRVGKECVSTCRSRWLPVH